MSQRSIIVGLITYAVFNVVLMVAYALSMLGPVPFGLIFLLLFVGVIGAIGALPAYLFFSRDGFTAQLALFMFAVFSGLAWFNWCCLQAASAAC